MLSTRNRRTVSRLITASIVGAIRWYNECPTSWRDKAEKDLKDQLGRVWRERDSPAQALGHNFETKVYQYADKTLDAGSDHFKWFVEQCRGGQFQRKASKYITLDGVEYCLYGKLDVWFPTIIKDIKTTSNYKGEAHYLESFQHPLYCYLENINDFAYIVAEFEDSSGKPKILAHHEIKYHVSDKALLEKYIFDKVRAAIAFLNQHAELMELYVTKFSKENKNG